MVATSDVAEIEGDIGSILYRQLPTFVFRLERFQTQGKLRNYLSTPSLTWIDGVAKPLEVGLKDLTRAVDARLNPPVVVHRKDWDDSDRDRDVGPVVDPVPVPTPDPDPPWKPTQKADPAPPPPRDIAGELLRVGGVPANLKPLRGFFSYSRVDDRFSGNALSTLRDKIAHELHMQLGREVELWQDTNDIRKGARWEAEIRNGIASSIFFIPIVTPNSINSAKCAVEFNAFREQEKSIQRRDLIFPIVYIDVWQLKREEFWKNNDRLELIGERQYEDFTELRHLSLDDGAVKKQIGKFCKNIVEVLLKRIDDPDG